MPAAEHAASRFHVRWYAITMLFLAFDMEMIFMYPWTRVDSSRCCPSAIA
jgi:NADH-quinone oxidoreductase subunit A